MSDDLDAALNRYRGAATRQQLLRHLRATELDEHIRRGRLVRLFHRTYAYPWDQDVPEIRRLAALRSVAHPVVLSHLTALAAWDLTPPTWHSPPAPATETIHVTVPHTRTPRHQGGLVVHREVGVPAMTTLAGLPTVGPATAIVTSWPLLPMRARRAPVIDAVRRRLTTPIRLEREIARLPRLSGRRDLVELVCLLAQGCESELEIWGLQQVFAGRAFTHSIRQLRVVARGRTYRLDLGFSREKVAVELDGDAFHSSHQARERDRLRDAGLATAGWLTLRFTYRRLHEDPAGCRGDLIAVLASRG